MKTIIGSRVPAVPLGYVHSGAVEAISTDKLFANSSAVVIGIPGAFTPVCSNQHVPNFVANADLLVASGYGKLVCISANDPFVLAAWKREIDPADKILFLSDGNLEFCSALGLVIENKSLFLGRRSQRYLLIIQNMKIQYVRVEDDILDYSCTKAEDVIAHDGMRRVGAVS